MKRKTSRVGVLYGVSSDALKESNGYYYDYQGFQCIKEGDLVYWEVDDVCLVVDPTVRSVVPCTFLVHSSILKHDLVLKDFSIRSNTCIPQLPSYKEFDSESVSSLHPHKENVKENVKQLISPLHPNKVIGIDHIVLFTQNLESTKLLFKQQLHLEPRREMQLLGRQMAFYRLGSLMIELVGPINNPSTPMELATRQSILSFLGSASIALWGITWISSDIHATHQYYTTHAKPLKPSIQDERRLFFVLNHSELDIPFAMALIEPVMKMKL